MKKAVPPAPLRPCIYIGRKYMDYTEKLNRMDEHLRQHPNDYQTVISRLKTASKAYDYRKKKEADYRLKRVAEVRRQLKELQRGKENI